MNHAISAEVNTTVITPTAMVFAAANSNAESCLSTPILKLTIGCINGARSIAPMITEVELMKSPNVAIIVDNISNITKVALILLSSLRFVNRDTYCS